MSQRQITELCQHKGKCWKMILDEEETYFLHCEIVFEYSLKKGLTMPQSAIAEILHSSEVRRARERALYLLDMKDYSYAQMLKKLEENYSEDTCFEVMDILVDLGVINDINYAKNLAERLVMGKKRGFYRAKQEMKQKGLSDDVILEALSDYNNVYEDNLREIINYKYAHNLDDEKGIEKVKAALVRQGYSYDQINSVLKEYEN